MTNEEVMEIRAAAVRVFQNFPPSTLAAVIVAMHANAEDAPDCGQFAAIRDQALVELESNDPAYLAEYLIQHSIGKTLAIGVLAEQRRIAQEML